MTKRLEGDLGHVLHPLPKEGVRPYAAFLEYIRMGPKRSLRLVGRKLGKSQDICERWSSRFKWVERAQDWDVRQAKRAAEAGDKAADHVALTLAEQRARVQESAWELFELLRKKALELLAKPTANMRPRIGDIVRLAEAGDALGRLAAGLPSRVTGLSDPEGRSLRIQNGADSPPIIIHFSDDDDTRAAVAQFGPRPARGNGAVNP